MDEGGDDDDDERYDYDYDSDGGFTGFEARPPVSSSPPARAARAVDWQCGVCTVLNDACRTTCEVCGASCRGDAAPQPWPCAGCRQTNVASARRCAYCRARPGDAASSAGGATAAAQETRTASADIPDFELTTPSARALPPAPSPRPFAAAAAPPADDAASPGRARQ